MAIFNSLSAPSLRAVGPRATPRAAPIPLIVSQRITIHRRSPKISVESDLRPLGNPNSLNRHYGLAAIYGLRLFAGLRTPLRIPGSPATAAFCSLEEYGISLEIPVGVCPAGPPFALETIPFYLRGEHPMRRRQALFADAGQESVLDELSFVWELAVLLVRKLDQLTGTQGRVCDEL
jgi:hypothetical protein